MTKDYIYIKIHNGMNLSKCSIILKDKCNRVIFEGVTDNFGRIKIPICNNEVYKLIIISDSKTMVVPLVAKANEIYCINISNDINKSHLITVVLLDADNPNLIIKRGEITLWENIPSQ